MAVTVPASSMLLAAARREPSRPTPVWFMRQAGRYLPEYRAIRERHTLLEICADPHLAAEVTLQPVRRLGVDAAIIFADILLPLVPMGLDLAFVEGEGPVIRNRIRGPADVQRLSVIDVANALAPVAEAVRLTRSVLAPTVPVIGFAGAPFTVAAYAIEGGSSRHFADTKRFMYEHPEAWAEFLTKLVRVLGEYLTAQVAAGAEILQVFDSWAGVLSPADYRRYVLPHSRALFVQLGLLGVPVIHFGVNTGELLPLLVAAGGDVIGLDWRVELDEGWSRIGVERGVQGNLDPVALFAPPAELEARVRDVIARAQGRPGHIFNLGHGLLPNTPVDAVRRVVDLVHTLTA
ncbi:MAG TPA: uroporphyrinogen decarboxylase [Gemmatimonadales bacterium]|nr:uroporphyrinogen decarboxylase [Gemmatimonadales bacterium]